MIRVWTVYQNPSDYPDKFVARLWLLDTPTETAIVGDSFEDVSRGLQAAGLVFLARSPGDDPCIVGVWL